MKNLRTHIGTILLIGYLFIVCVANASASGVAPGALEWTVYELDSGVRYEKSRVVEVFEEGSALCTRVFYPPPKPKSQAVMVYEGSLDSLIPESILFKGVDGRVRIQDTEKFPHSIHGQMSMNFLGHNYGGSGVLIGPHHFLTAGHCVYDKGNWATNIRVRLALNGSVAPFGEAFGAKIYACNQWLECGNREYDIALVVLDRSVGYETGWSGLLSLTDDDLLKETVHVTGYPGDKDFKEMWTMDHPLEGAGEEQFSYKIDTYGGQSGGAVWIRKWGNPLVVGVHTNGGITSNFGVRLSRSKLETIVRQWIEETGEIANTAVSVTGVVATYPGSSVVSGGPSGDIAFPLGPAIPDVALGHEAVYVRFMNGKLIYRPTPGSDVGKREIRFADVVNPATLEGTFDLSECDDAGTYLSINAGYRKGKIAANEGKVEVWIVPHFLVGKDIGTTAKHYAPIMGEWTTRATVAPIGLFWTWGGWTDMSYYEYLTTYSFDALSDGNAIGARPHIRSNPAEITPGWYMWALHCNRHGYASDAINKILLQF